MADAHKAHHQDPGRRRALPAYLRDLARSRQQLRRMTALYGALRQVNHAIVQAGSRAELLDAICRAMVEHGPFAMAWIGWNDPATCEVQVVSQCGDQDGYLRGLQVRSDDSALGRGPMGAAIRTGSPVILNDFLGSTEALPWRERAQQADLRAAAAFPVLQHGRVAGALLVYARERDFFGDLEATLLVEAAADVGFGLEHLELEARRLQAEEARRMGASQLRALIDTLPDLVWMKDLDGVYLTCNTRFERFFGAPEEEIRGRTDYDFVAPELADFFRENDRKALAAGVPSRNEEEVTFKDDGHRERLETIKTPVHDSSGAVLGILGIGRDITERKLAADQLRLALDASRRSEEARHLAFAAIDQGASAVIITDTAGAIEYVNHAFQVSTGYSAREVLGRNPRFLQSGEHSEEFYRNLWATLTAGGTWRGRFHNRRKDGELYWEQAVISPVRDSAGRIAHYVAAKENITEALRLERERHQLEQQILYSQKMESLGSLAGGVAHDMNNVLGAILVIASSNLEAQPEGSPLHRALDTIAKAATRGGQMVKGLLNFARQNPVEEVPVDLNQVLQEVVQLLERTIFSRIRLDLELEPGLRMIRGDGNALAHSLMNLCVNSADAMPGEGTLTLRTRNADQDMVEVQVGDTGSGMSEQVREKALEPFFTTKAQGKGTGLGLSMVYGVVKAHHGRMEIQSEPDRGTRVTLLFPACETPAAAADGPQRPAAAAPGPGLEVLLVDDDEFIQSSVREMLDGLGHSTRAALSGEEALAQLEAGLRPDLVILDLNMPGLGGSATLPRLRLLRPELPVLIATGKADQAALDLVDSQPYVTLLAKPFTIDEFRRTLDRLERA